MALMTLTGSLLREAVGSLRRCLYTVEHDFIVPNIQTLFEEIARIQVPYSQHLRHCLWAEMIPPEERQCHEVIHRKDPPCVDYRNEKCTLEPHSRPSRIDEIYGTDRWPEKKTDQTPCDPKPCCRPGCDPYSNNKLFSPIEDWLKALYIR